SPTSALAPLPMSILYESYSIRVECSIIPFHRTAFNSHDIAAAQNHHLTSPICLHGDHIPPQQTSPHHHHHNPPFQAMDMAPTPTSILSPSSPATTQLPTSRQPKLKTPLPLSASQEAQVRALYYANVRARC